MLETGTKLPTAVETYFADLQRISASDGATGERLYHSTRTNLLNALGSTLKPKVSSRNSSHTGIVGPWVARIRRMRFSNSLPQFGG